MILKTINRLPFWSIKFLICNKLVLGLTSIGKRDIFVYHIAYIINGIYIYLTITIIVAWMRANMDLRLIVFIGDNGKTNLIQIRNSKDQNVKQVILEGPKCTFETFKNLNAVL